MEKYSDIMLNHLKSGEAKNIFTAISYHIPELAPFKNKQIILKNYLTENGLIRQVNGSAYRITPNGFTIANSGGWVHYVGRQQEEQNIEQKIRHLTIKDLEGSIFHLKYWWAITLISGLLGGIITVLVQMMLKDINAL